METKFDIHDVSEMQAEGILMLFCPKCGERDKLCPDTEYWSADKWPEGGIKFNPGPHREGQRMTGKTKCSICNNVF